MTLQQQAVLTAITGFSREYGYPPTIREIARIIGISGPTAHKHVTRLADLNIIVRSNGARTIRVLNSPLAAYAHYDEGAA